MKKFIIVFFLLILPLNVYSLDLELNSKYAIVYDQQDEKVLYQKGNLDDEVAIASLTKIMTTIVAIENTSDLDKMVEINLAMLSGIPFDASVAGLKLGDRVTIRDLLYASLLPSGADATNSLAYIVSGSISKYVDLMNEYTHELGLKHTHFLNTTGYDKTGQYSTPEDVLKLLLYALDNEIFREIYSTREYTLSNNLTVKSTLLLYNKLYDYDLDGIVGTKTGSTSGAGTCMSAIICSNNRELIVITLGAPIEQKKGYNLEDLMNIKNTFDDSYDYRTLYKKDEILFNIPVKNSKENEFEVRVNEDVLLYLEEVDSEKIRFEYDGLEQLSYKNKLNEYLGSIKYYYGDKFIREDKVYLDESLKISYLKLLISNSFIIIPLVIVLLVCYKFLKNKNNKKTLLLKDNPI